MSVRVQYEINIILFRLDMYRAYDCLHIIHLFTYVGKIKHVW